MGALRFFFLSVGSVDDVEIDRFDAGVALRCRAWSYAGRAAHHLQRCHHTPSSSCMHTHTHINLLLVDLDHKREYMQ
jgi:prepilin signal peptidase PulO-like enzyme (type II secretory pathway)